MFTGRGCCYAGGVRIRSRISATLRWGGLLGCVLLVVAMVGSGLWQCEVSLNRPVSLNGPADILWSIGLRRGCAWLIRHDVSALGVWLPPGAEVKYGRLYPPSWAWWLEVDRRSVSLPEWLYVNVPLWMPLVVLAAPTGLLWYRRFRSRYGPGFCPKCGYSLAGLAAGVECPECGLG
jgi:hypothetical protein